MDEYVVEYKDESTYTTCAKERVVRCRDCAHGMGNGNLCSLFAFPLGDGYIIPADVEPDGFCSWGEPREVD